MRSALGQYVHLNWENYQKMGTRRRDEGKEAKFFNNANSQIFNIHRNQIRNQALKLKKPNLKALEAEYNILNERQFTNLKTRFDELRSINDKIDFLKPMFNMLDKSLSDETITEIIKSLKFNNNGNIEINSNFLKSTINFTLLPEIPKENTKDSHGRYLTTFLRRALETKDYIEQQVKVDIIDGETAQELGVELDNLINTVVSCIQKPDEKKEDIIQQLKLNKYYKRGKVSAELINKYIEILNTIRKKITDMSQLNTQLQASFVEFLGEMVSDGATATSKQMIQLFFSDLQNKVRPGQKQTQALSGGDFRIFSDFEIDEEWLRQQESDIQKKVVKIGKDSFELKPIRSSVSQKADAEVLLQGEKINLSLKNTDLSNALLKEQEEGLRYWQIPSIKLQSSSLLLFLMGAQQQMQNLGTHYLNIFAKHTDENDSYTKMREQANQAMLLNLVFSGLSGQGQGRQDGYAEVLAVYDKAKSVNGLPRIKFFDMYDIVTSPNLKDGAIIHPSIETISLKNEREGQDNSSAQANKRISKLLLEARTKNISINLSHRFLNNLYMSART